VARKPVKRASRRPDRDDRGKRKGCLYCKAKVTEVDYKQHDVLRAFVSERGKIRGRRVTGACRRHQAQLATAVKRAREVALLHYVGT
jgi:small subunit ribosomal protein S18